MVSPSRRVSKVKERGVAVIMAMWLLAVLAIIGTTFVFMMRLEPIIARNQRNETMAMYAAQAGLDYAVYLLKKDRDTAPTLDHLAEAWYTIFVGSDVDNDGDGTNDSGWIALTDTDGNAYGFYAVRVTDEGGKINLNFNLAAKDYFKDLMTDSQVDPPVSMSKADMAQAIINYRDGTQTGSAETFEYLEELDRVTGLGTGTVENNRNYLTVYDGDPPILEVNINTVPYQVLQGLQTTAQTDGSLSDAECRDIIDYRDTNTIKYGTESEPEYTSGYSIYDVDQMNQGYFETLNWVGANNGIPDFGDARNIQEQDVIDLTGGGTKPDQLRLNSQGYFEIVSTGEVRDASGNALATKKLRATLNRLATGSGPTDFVIRFYEEIPED